MTDLEDFIHRLHYRTFDKLWEHVKEAYPDINEQQVKAILEKFVRDPKHIKKINKKYMKPVFSDHPHAWMMDLLFNEGTTPDYQDKDILEAKQHDVVNYPGKEQPTYWYIFININTRFACAYKLYAKTDDAILHVLEQFVEEHKCRSLTSDKEPALISDKVTNFLTAKKISQFIVLNENHTSLSIIDSFIRHLRDRNITNEKSDYQSHHSKYRNFTVGRMQKLLDTYNNTTHGTTHLKPIDMENDIKLERQYIAYCLIRKHKSKNHDIPNGNYVRIVLQKSPMKKMRFRVSRECYQVFDRDGMNYIVGAFDGRYTTVPRHRLIDLGKNRPEKYKFATTIPEGKLLPKSIINKEGERYLVDYGNGAGFMTKAQLRRHHMQVESKIEKAFNQRVNRVNMDRHGQDDDDRILAEN